eukprot:Rhum_TRINITY_DN3859_c0_g1::Rhum_TRINITY_DN3859_c0_g1_i1::g.12249::m.12249
MSLCFVGFACFLLCSSGKSLGNTRKVVVLVRLLRRGVNVVLAGSRKVRLEETVSLAELPDVVLRTTHPRRKRVRGKERPLRLVLRGTVGVREVGAVVRVLLKVVPVVNLRLLRCPHRPVGLPHHEAAALRVLRAQVVDPPVLADVVGHLSEDPVAVGLYGLSVRLAQPRHVVVYLVHRLQVLREVVEVGVGIGKVLVVLTPEVLPVLLRLQEAVRVVHLVDVRVRRLPPLQVLHEHLLVAHEADARLDLRRRLQRPEGAPHLQVLVHEQPVPQVPVGLDSLLVRGQLRLPADGLLAVLQRQAVHPRKPLRRPALGRAGVELVHLRPALLHHHLPREHAVLQFLLRYVGKLRGQVPEGVHQVTHVGRLFAELGEPVHDGDLLEHRFALALLPDAVDEPLRVFSVPVQHVQVVVLFAEVGALRYVAHVHGEDAVQEAVADGGLFVSVKHLGALPRHAQHVNDILVLV